MIPTRRSATGSGLLHPHHSVLKQVKQVKLFSRDSQALEASTCRYTPFCSVPFCALNGGYAYTGNAASSMLLHWLARAVLLMSHTLGGKNSYTTLSQPYTPCGQPYTTLLWYKSVIPLPLRGLADTLLGLRPRSVYALNLFVVVV